MCRVPVPVPVPTTNLGGPIGRAATRDKLPFTHKPCRVCQLSDPQVYRVQTSWLFVFLTFSPMPRVAHSLLPQTPVALLDEDILSDVVPSNIVSRQV